MLGLSSYLNFAWRGLAKVVTRYSGLKKKGCFMVMPQKKLGRVGTIFF